MQSKQPQSFGNKHGIPARQIVSETNAMHKSGRTHHGFTQMQQQQQQQMFGSRPQTTAGSGNGAPGRQGQQNSASVGIIQQQNGQNHPSPSIQVIEGKRGGARVFSQANQNNVYVSQSQQKTAHNYETQNTISPNIKEMMNTSAPICISNIIGQSQQLTGPGGQRPTQSRGQARRQTTGNISGIRKTTTAPYTGNLGIISGQTIRAQTRDAIQGQNPKYKLEQVAVNSIGTIGSFDASSHAQQQHPNHSGNKKFINQHAMQVQQQQLKYNEEDGYMRGARIADKIQEFYHSGAAQSSQLTLQNVTNQTSFVKTGGAGQIPVHPGMVQPNRDQVQSQGGVRQNKGIVVTADDQKRAASAYGGSGNQGQRRNLVIHKQNTGVTPNQGQIGGDTRPNNQDGHVQSNQQKVNNFFQYQQSSNNYVSDNARIPQRGQQNFQNPSSLGSNHFTERDVQQNFPPRTSHQKESFKVTKVHTGESQDFISHNQTQDHAITNKDTVTSPLSMGKIHHNQNETPASRVTDQSGVTNNDIRQIKLNYLQLNKRQIGVPPQTAQPGAKRGPNLQAAAQAAEEKTQPDAQEAMVDMERHPLDKAQIYKMEGAPALEDQEFCTEGSTIDNLDHYIIGKRIGQGAYAVVRLGLHKILNQKIAVKIYEKVKLMEPNRRKSVKREMKIMEKLDHPNIAKLYEAFESHKQVFIIMEYVNGGSLHGYLKMKPNRQMPELEAKFLWIQVVQAIYYCHQRNVTHRDVKLENILLDETKTVVKMIDFGFSTCIPHERKVKIFCGTPSYMAPEIVSKIEYSGPPADIWALGVLLFALLCGKFPFKGANDKELYSHICTKELVFPDHVSAGAKKFLNKIFQKDPDRRPSARDILRDPWIDISLQEMEMLSPRHAHGFANNSDLINYERGQQMNQTQRISGVPAKPNTAIANGTRPKMIQNPGMVIDPQNINFATNQTGSKDKRLTMLPEAIKKFILDKNQIRIGVKTSPTPPQHNLNKSQGNNQVQQQRNDINMEAYNAYYNNHEAPQKEVDQKVVSSSAPNTNIINNIMHINHSGANINIMAGPNCQNNFIFNHTAPISLNFYKENQQQQQQAVSSPTAVDANEISPVQQDQKQINQV